MYKDYTHHKFFEIETLDHAVNSPLPFVITYIIK